MNVLLDAIQVARNGRYLILDPVQQEQLEQPKSAVLAAKKKVLFDASFGYLSLSVLRLQALTSASAVLLSLADQMRPKTAAGSPSSAQQQLDPDLEELIEMRKHWRLKKVGNTIVGDLSYFAGEHSRWLIISRTHKCSISGGKYRPNATFEVKKSEITTAPSNTSGSPGVSKASTINKGQRWKVILPKDLEEALRLRVIIEPPAAAASGQGADMSYFGRRPLPKSINEAGWQEKLQLAQRTLFCRDLFAQVSILVLWGLEMVFKVRIFFLAGERSRPCSGPMLRSSRTFSNHRTALRVFADGLVGPVRL